MIKFTDAAFYYKQEPQQIKAWEYLQEKVSEDILGEFTTIYRETPPTPPRTKLTPGSPMSQLVTPNFTYSELCNGGQEARRFTAQDQCDIATEICEYLEKLRDKFGPIKITSGHRPPAINASVGGASQSEHLYQVGCGAVDIYPVNGRGQEMENFCDQDWPYSVGYGMSYRGFVHLGIRAGRPRVRWDY
jgi:hypothetical protein